MAGSKQTVLLFHSKRILQIKRFYSNLYHSAYRSRSSSFLQSNFSNVPSKNYKKELGYTRFVQRARFSNKTYDNRSEGRLTNTAPSFKDYFKAYIQLNYDGWVVKISKYGKNLSLYDLIWLMHHTDRSNRFDPEKFMFEVHAILEEISKCYKEANTQSLVDSRIVSGDVLDKINEWIKNKNHFTFRQEDVFDAFFFPFKKEYMPEINATLIHMHVIIQHFENGADAKNALTRQQAQKCRLFPSRMDHEEDVLNKLKGLKKNGMSGEELFLSRIYDTEQNKLVGPWVVTGLWRKKFKVPHNEL